MSSIRLPEVRQAPAYRRVLTGAAVLCLLSYFFLFTGRGLRSDFSYDDLMNMYAAAVRPLSRHITDVLLFFRFSETYRPVGATFYSLLYSTFGFAPLPFRIACFALLLANLWLSYLVSRRLSGSREIGAVAAMLMVFHGETTNLYFNTGFCYDLFCFFFYASALAYYLRIRQAGIIPGWRQLTILGGIYLLCLDSKEMAVSLPVMLGIYELLAHPPQSCVWRWIRNEGRGALVTGFMTAAFLAGRVTSAKGLPSIGPYQPHLRLDVYLDHAWHFLWYVLYKAEWASPPVLAAIGITMAVVAWWSGQVHLRFAFLWMLIGILPVAFILQRGLDAVTIPMLGLALFIATVLVEFTRWIWRKDGGWRPIVVFPCLLLLVQFVHRHKGPQDFDPWMRDGWYIRSLYSQLRAMDPPIPKGARILFVNDPFPPFEWNSVFLVYLLTRDSSIRIERPDRLSRDRSAEETIGFDLVLSVEDGNVRECDPAPFQEVTVREVLSKGCVALAHRNGA